MSGDAEPLLAIAFEAEVIAWRGPSPYFFVAVPDDQAAGVRGVAKAATYGWGVVPVEAWINGAAFQTSLFPKGDTYLLPLKVAVRKKADVTMGDRVAVEMTIHPARRSAGSVR